MPTRPSDDQLIAALQSGDTRPLENLYADHRDDFFHWAGRRFDAGRHDLEDAWQEAVIAFYCNVQSGKLTALRYGARTWLFAVGYKRLLNANRRTKRILLKDRIDNTLLTGDFLEEEVDPEQRRRLQSAMKMLSPQCRQMLVARYYLGKVVEAIQHEWGLASANATSAMLARCLRRLKEVIKKAVVG